MEAGWGWGAHYTWVAMVLQGIRIRSESEGWGEGWGRGGRGGLWKLGRGGVHTTPGWLWYFKVSESNQRVRGGGRGGRGGCGHWVWVGDF